MELERFGSDYLSGKSTTQGIGAGRLTFFQYCVVKAWSGII